MKRILAIIAVLAYMFTASSMVHAHVMGFSHIHKAGAQSHCHTNNNTSESNMDCCELFTTNNYSLVSLQIQDHIKSLAHSVPYFSPSKNLDVVYAYTYTPNHPPGPNIGKYTKFSDLVGIVVYIG